MRADDVIRVASANLLDGGVDRDGSLVRRDQTVAELRDWCPHVVLVQELYAPGEEQVRCHLRAFANLLGLEPAALGPPRGSRRLRTAVLIDTGVCEVLDDGPVPVRDAPYWAEATVLIRAIDTMVQLASVHAPATTAVGQLAEAQRLATRTAQRGVLALVGGDWNCYSPDDALTDDDLNDLPPHLRPARMRISQGERFAANYDVHCTLTSVGMIDPVPRLPADRRHPPHPPGTGSHPRARIDRFYVWPGDQMMAATGSYHQKPNPGSDHHLALVTLNLDVLATIAPPWPLL